MIKNADRFVKAGWAIARFLFPAITLNKNSKKKFINQSKKRIMNTVVKRMKRKTPRFFQKVRNIGLSVAAVSAAILAAPVALPVILVKAAGYLAVAGSVASTISQSAVQNDKWLPGYLKLWMSNHLARWRRREQREERWPLYWWILQQQIFWKLRFFLQPVLRWALELVCCWKCLSGNGKNEPPPKSSPQGEDLIN